jgi:hypothetical protein
MMQVKTFRRSPYSIPVDAGTNDLQTRIRQKMRIRPLVHTFRNRLLVATARAMGRYAGLLSRALARHQRCQAA